MSILSKGSIFTILKGACMGVAEVIPGVSGGTIAFITGIYERLINAIKSVDMQALKLLTSFKLKAFFKKIDGLFLLTLAVGMVLGIGVGVLGIGHLLEHFPAPVWAFFFGLIIASAIYIGRQIKTWDIKVISALVIGAAIALIVTFMSPTEGSTNLLWVFLCGCIAISALILPGVSGSFILLLLGMYTVVRDAAEHVLKDQEISSVILLLTFMVGCGVGLLSFARVMSYTFKHYREVTLGLLTGFMVGSLRKIWPWRNVETFLDKETGDIITHQGSSRALPEEIQILSEQLVLPGGYMDTPYMGISIVSMLMGFLVLYIFSKVELKES